MEFHDSDQSCHISMAELADVCSNNFLTCFNFLESANPPDAGDVTDALALCPEVFLGPDIGCVAGPAPFKYHLQTSKLPIKITCRYR